MSQQQGLRFSFAQDRHTRRYILNKLLAHIEDGRYEDAVAIEGEFEDLEDYFDMKDHHHHLNHWCMQDYNGTVPTDIRELYTEYIQIGQRMRVKLLRKALADSGP